MNGGLGFVFLFGLGALAITGAAMAFSWWMEPGRRATRLMSNLMGGHLDVVEVAPIRGQGVGLSIAPPGVAVVRRSGDMGLAFGFEELLGAELIFNGEVRARAFRAEPRRPLDQTHPVVSHVCVRLVFDDVRDPDFELVLLHPDDPRPEPARKVEAARRLFAHLEAVIRQPLNGPGEA
jgi:hypothetical protein